MGNNIFSISRNIDIVLCIDGTRSMSPCILGIQDFAKYIYDSIFNEMNKNGSSVDMMRIKTIVFRDYKQKDNATAMQESRFFELPSEVDEFQ